MRDFPASHLILFLVLSRRLALSAGVIAAIVLLGGSAAQYVLAAPRVVATPVAGCAGPPEYVASASVPQSVNVGGITRKFTVRLPAGYTQGRPSPLIIAYHGRGEAAMFFERYTQLSRLPAILVYPEAMHSSSGPRSWQGAPYSDPKADDIGFTREIIRTVRANACVDNGRVFAVGRSNGGGLANLLACRLPGQFAAIAMVSGAFYPQANQGCAQARPVSRIEFHGTADRIVPYWGLQKFGSVLPPIPDEVGDWARRAGCAPPIESRIANATARIDWLACQPGVMVSHVRIEGGTHLWPGSGTTPLRPSNHVNAAALIWQFFQLARPGLTG
jgi:polyhydroxybutyrate depolymerase